MFGQSELCAQPGTSHQSQSGVAVGEYCRLDTAFSMIASVFDVPSGTLEALTVPYLTVSAGLSARTCPPLTMIPLNVFVSFELGGTVFCHSLPHSIMTPA